MVRGHARAYRRRLQAELEKLFAEIHTPHEVAASFAIGVFVATLPTFGSGLVLFFALAHLSDRVSKVALFAAVLVFNPVVKWGIYVLSYLIGVRLLGPVPGVELAAPSLSAGTGVLVRIVLGSFLLAVVFTVVGYVAVYKVVGEWRRRELELEAFVPEGLVD